VELISRFGAWLQTPVGAAVSFVIGIGVGLVLAALSGTTEKSTGEMHRIDYVERDRYSEEVYRLVGFGRSIIMRWFWGWLRRISFAIPAGDQVEEIQYVSGKTGDSDSIPSKRWQEQICRLRSCVSASIVRIVQVHKVFFREQQPDVISLVLRRPMSYDELDERIEISDPTISQMPGGQRVKYEIENRWDRDVINFKFDLLSAPQEPDRISGVHARHETGDEISVQSRDILRIHEIPWDVYERQRQEGSEFLGGETRLELQVTRLKPGKTIVQVDYEWNPGESSDG